MSNQRARMTRFAACAMTPMFITLYAQATPLDLAQTRTQINGGQVQAAITALKAELDENPADEPARLLLAEAFEKAGDLNGALGAWEDLKVLTSDDDNLRTARRAISRIRAGSWTLPTSETSPAQVRRSIRSRSPCRRWTGTG